MDKCRTTKLKFIYVNLKTYVDFGVENNDQNSKFKVDDSSI